MNKIVFFILLLGLVPSVFSQAAKGDVKETEGKVTETKLITVAEQDMWKLAFYGFVKADYIYATKSVVSYGRENLQAANQAKRQVQRDDYQTRQNIQLHDTRLGFKSKYSDKLTGVIEMDFIDFDKSSPNVNVRPRLRQAYVDWDVSKQFQLFAGQKWDIFSPLNPDTYNIINNLLYLGNVGWMREQFGFGYQIIPSIKLSAAVGNTAVNVNPGPSVVEKNPSPTFAFQIKWTPNKENTVYLSGISVRKLYSDPNSDPTLMANKSLFYDGSANSYYYPTYQLGKSPKIYREASGLSLGSEYRPEGEKFRLKWEGNWGRNLSDLNTLGIGQAQVTTAGKRFLFSETGILTQSSSDGLLNRSNKNGLYAYEKDRAEVVSIEEMGGWVSTIYKIDPKFELGIFMGATKISNPKNLEPANKISTTNPDKYELVDFSKTQSDPANGIWSPALIGRMRESSSIGYHLTYLAETGLKIFFQHEYIQTFYQDAAREKGIYAFIKSVDIDTGTIALKEVTPGYLKASEKATAHMIRVGTIFNF